MIGNPVISVIIPVYNAELWLRECLDSIISQSASDFEVICVNDASVDKSLQILYEYSMRDPRFHVINLPENQGAMMARKHGIDSANGSYYFFCDADDYLPVDALSVLGDKSISADADIIASDITLIRKDGRTTRKSRGKIGNNNTTYLKALLTGTTCSLSGALFRRNLFDDSGCIFLSHCNYSEDRILLSHILIKTNCKVAYMPVSTYNYRINTSSSSRKPLTDSDLRSQLRSLWLSYEIIDSAIGDDTIVKLNKYFILRMIGYFIECGYDIESLPGVDIRTKEFLKRKNLVTILGFRLGNHVHLCNKNERYRRFAHSCRRLIRRIQGKE